ncbi:MAG: hypothetical protein ABI574_10375 [Burkholderiales bacterium]
MNRRVATLLGVLGSVPLLSGFFWPQYFDIAWDEDVQLHDGRVIVVHLKYTYERVSRLSRYDRSTRRDVEMTIPANEFNKAATQLFKGFAPILLDQQDGLWYVVIMGGHYARSREIAGQDWGVDQNGQGQRVAMYRDGKFVPISMSQLPEKFTTPNLLLDYAPVEELSHLNGRHVTLDMKAKYLQKYPLGPGDQMIYRPRPSQQSK